MTRRVYDVQRGERRKIVRRKGHERAGRTVPRQDLVRVQESGHVRREAESVVGRPGVGADVRSGLA